MPIIFAFLQKSLACFRIAAKKISLNSLKKHKVLFGMVSANIIEVLARNAKSCGFFNVHIKRHGSLLSERHLNGEK